MLLEIKEKVKKQLHYTKTLKVRVRKEEDKTEFVEINVPQLACGITLEEITSIFANNTIIEYLVVKAINKFLVVESIREEKKNITAINRVNKLIKEGKLSKDCFPF